MIAVRGRALLFAALIASFSGCDTISSYHVVVAEPSPVTSATSSPAPDPTPDATPTPEPTTPQETGPTHISVFIKNDSIWAFSTTVTLTLAATDASEMYITNSSGCSSGGNWESYATSKSWTLSQPSGTATVYAKFKNVLGLESDCTSDTITVVTVSGTVSHFVGSFGGTGTRDGTASEARFGQANGVTSDGTYLYVTDTASHTIRKVVIATGVTSTFAGISGSSGSTNDPGASATFFQPTGITNDGTNLYVTDTGNQTIRKIVIATGVVSTFAGSNGVSGASDDTGLAASFSNPIGITTDNTYLYVADNGNSTIRKIVIGSRLVSTLAGTAGATGDHDDTGAAAQFYSPSGLAIDAANLYVTDSTNYNVRKIVIASRVVTTFAGTSGVQGFTDNTGILAKFGQPTGIVSDGVNLFITDNVYNTVRQIVIANQAVTTFAGGIDMAGNTDASGTSARFSGPAGIAYDGTHLFVTDNGTAIRKIVKATADVTTLAGTSGPFFGTTNASGPSAKFHTPHGITGDETNLYVADMANHTIRKIVVGTGSVSTFAGTAGSQGSANGVGSDARFHSPTGITQAGGNLFVADLDNYLIRKIVISTGEVSTLAGTLGTPGTIDDTGTAARFSRIYDLTTDGTNLYVADFDNNTIRKVVIATGVVTTFAGTTGVSGFVNDVGTSAQFYQPYAITCDGSNLFIADTYNTAIRKIEISSRNVTTIASNPGANFGTLSGITTDGTNLFLVDFWDQTIRKVVIATGVVSTLAGQSAASGASDGSGSTANFNYPWGITQAGPYLFVTDSQNHAVRKIE